MFNLKSSDGLFNRKFNKNYIFYWLIFIFFVTSESTAKLPCMYYFPKLELLYNMNIFKSLSRDSKVLKSSFYNIKNQNKLSGEYLLNICEEIKELNICQPKDEKKKIIPKGTFSLTTRLPNVL